MKFVKIQSSLSALLALLLYTSATAVAQDVPAVQVSYEATMADRAGQVRVHETGTLSRTTAAGDMLALCRLSLVTGAAC